MSSCSRTTLKPTFVNRAGHNPLLSRGEFHNLVTSSEHKSVDIVPICQSVSHLFPPEHFLQTLRTKLNQLELILSPFTQGKVCVFHKICRNHLFPELVIASHPPPHTHTLISLTPLLNNLSLLWPCIKFKSETRPRFKVCYPADGLSWLLFNDCLVIFSKETTSKQLLEPSEVEIWVMDWWPIQGVSLPPADRWERPRQPPRDPDMNRKWIDSVPFSFLKAFSLHWLQS